MDKLYDIAKRMVKDERARQHTTAPATRLTPPQPERGPVYEYQHRVSVWNYQTGKCHRGVFRTREAAEEMMDRTEGSEKTYTAEMGDWPYGLWVTAFDAREALARAGDRWCEGEKQ